MTDQDTRHPITQITIEDEMQRSYLDYAMSVIVSRALPDIRDGLKPVHRRILYAMKEGGYGADRPFRKSARIVGDVMGKYHPHGDASIYDSMVRMAQDFSMRLMLISGQGNFGSMDGDRAAAMRYTEVRLSQAAETLLQDIAYETVDFRPNYDESEQEPIILPSRLPNLLINGSSGIAVGMATNIPPHNPEEIINACLALIDNPQMELDELMNYVKGPDFPTGGEILRIAEMRVAYATGRGTILIRARCHIEEKSNNQESIIVTEIPYQVNKSRLVERIAELIKEGKISGISDLRDESNRQGVRIVMALKKDAQSNVVLSRLYKYSSLQVSFGFNMLALDGQKPKIFALKQALEAFLAFREDVLLRKTGFLLRKARSRAHILAGLMIAIGNLDEIIALIRKAPDPVIARDMLQAQEWKAENIRPFLKIAGEKIESLQQENLYRLSEKQARAILDLRLHRLTGLEQHKILEEAEEIGREITAHLDILRSRPTRLQVMREDLNEMKEKFSSPRRSLINPENPDTPIEDLISCEDVVVTVTNSGYIKRVPLSTYRAQKRGGKGRIGMNVHDQDFIREIFMTSTHTTMLFFTTAGMAYRIKVYELPSGAPQNRGKPLVNLLPLNPDEKVSTVMPFPDKDHETTTIAFATRKGNVRRNTLSDFANVNSGGKIAMKLSPNDSLIGTRVCQPGQDIILASRFGRCVRFPIEDVRIFQSRASSGVRGIKLSEGDEVVSMSLLEHTTIDIDARTNYLRGAALQRRPEQKEKLEAEDMALLKEWQQNPDFIKWHQAEQFLLTFSEKGFGKRSSTYEYRITKRGGSGIQNLKVTEKTGKIVASFPVEEKEQIIMATDQGQLTRFPVKDIRICGRISQGVTLFRINKEEHVVSATRLKDSDPVQEEKQEAGEISENQDQGTPSA